MSLYIHALRRTLEAHGLRPDTLTAGALQRCKVEGDTHGKQSGAYRLFDDGRPLCLFWNWKQGGERQCWVADSDKPLSKAEQERQRSRIFIAQQERQIQQVKDWAQNRTQLCALWDAARPLTGDCVASRYLAGRGLDVPETAALRLHPAMAYYHEGECIGSYPVMLGALTRPERAGDVVALHRTYLSRDGQKAPVPVAKKLTRTCGPTAGASIKIGAVQCDGRLGVAEGIETAIAARMLAGGLTVWAATSAGMLAKFEPPKGTQSLYIFGDNDSNEVGQSAAYQLGNRVAGRYVTRVLIPEVRGTDWANELEKRLGEGE